MKRNEFIAQTAARWGFAERGDESGLFITLEHVKQLADMLEKEKCAPWLEPTEQRDMMDALPEILPKMMDKMGLSMPGRLPDPALGVAIVDVKTPGTSVAAMLADLSKQIPPQAAVPPGTWELCFRPSSISNGGIVLPGHAAN